MNTDSGKLDFEIRLLLENMQRDAKRAQDIIGGIGRTAEKEGSLMDSAFRKAGGAMAAFFTAQKATDFVRQVVKVRGEMESLQISFQVLAGEKGIPLFEEIKDFAVKTPMMMGDLAKGAQTLMAFNTAADDVMPILRAIGDISMGNSQKFQSLTLAFSQMSSTGKLMGQDLLQMINSGFNPLAVISEQTGKSIGELKEEMAAGAISADMIKQAFMDATSEGGKFYGMMDKMSMGIEGSISNLEGAIEDMMNSIGENMQGIITGSIQAAQKLVENYEEVGKAISVIAAGYGGYKAALVTANVLTAIATERAKGYTLAEIARYKRLLLSEKAQKLLNAAIAKSPYVIAAAAVAGLVYGLWKFFEVEDQTKKAAEDHAKAMDELNQKYSENKQHVDSLIGVLESETAARSEQIAALEELKKQYPGIVDKYLDEEGHLINKKKLLQEIAELDAANKHSDIQSQYLEADKNLRRYKGVKKLRDNGVPMNASDNDLFENQPFWKSTDSYIEEQIQYWEEETKKFKGAYDESSYNTFVATLGKKTLEDLKETKAIYENAGRELSALEQKYYDAIKSEIAKRDTPKETQNKEHWERKKKEAQEELDALADIEENKKRRNELLKLIEGYDKHLAFYSADNKGGGNDNKKAYDDAVASVQDETTKLTRDTASGQETDEVKKLQQEKANALADHDKEAAAEIAKFKELKLDTAELTEEYRKLREAKVAAYDMQIAAATDKQVAEEKAKLDEILNDYATYKQQREAIKNKYNDKRAQMYTTDESGNQVLNTDAGFTQGNVDEINSAEQLEQQALDEQFAMREAEYLAYCEQIADATLNQLQNDLLPRAQQMLASLDKSGASGQKVAAAKMAVKKTQEQIDDRKKNGDVPDKKAIKQWEALGDCIGETGNILSELGDEVGGVSGEFLAAAGNILSSTSAMVNTIATLASSAGQGMSLTAMMAAESISTVEKASVILAIISAAIQIVMAIVNAVRKALDKQHAEKMEELQNRVDALKDSYEELEEVLDEQFGQSANATLEDMNKNLEEQNRQLQEMIAAEESSKMGDEEAAQEYRDQIAENEKLIAENKKAAEEAIYGESVKSAIENFAEAYADAWASNEHSATSMRDTVRDMMQKMVTESIKDAIQCSGAINKIHEAMKAMWADGVLTEAEVEQLYAMADEAQAELDAKYGETLDNLNDPNREGVKKGIATASQESVDENNARLTTIQGHTYQLNENIAVVRADIATASAHLQEIRSMGGDAINHLAAIEEHTSELVSMNVRINKMQAALEDINTRGVKIKN